eukprot:489444_1
MYSVLLCIFHICVGMKCPKYWDIANKSTMTTFNLSSFIGNHYWYEMYAHDVAVLTHGCECVRCCQTWNNDDFQTLNNEYNCRKNSINNTHVTTINATIYPNYLNSTEGGKMSETVYNSNKSSYWVLDQANDYQYLLLYACLQTIPPDIEMQEYIFLYSRNYTLFPIELYRKWIQYLKNKNVQTNDIMPITQQDCW